MKLRNLRGAIRAFKGPISFRVHMPADKFGKPGGADMFLVLAKGELLTELDRVFDGEPMRETHMVVTSDGKLMDEESAARYGATAAGEEPATTPVATSAQSTAPANVVSNTATEELIDLLGDI